MVMEREKHEDLLIELLSPEIDTSRRTEILQELRVENATTRGEVEEATKAIEQLTKDKTDLVISNSKLFRQVGVVGDEKDEEENTKQFSEAITLEALEKR